MTLEAAMRLGVRCHILDKNPEAPAAPYTRYFTAGDTQDFDTVLRFSQACDVITIDSEHVNAAALVEIGRQGKFTTPQGNVLAVIQNKCRQKEFLQAHNIPTAPFKNFAEKSELLAIQWDFPLIQKKATAGYDGNGVKLLTSAADLAKAFDGESLIEEKISIAKEIAVIVATDRHGNRKVYDPVEMVFDTQKNILKYQICPAEISPEDTRLSQACALRAAEKLGIRGLLAVEMFITTMGEILVNEMAPRPHNSGHHTIEAAATSQYENLVRILLDLPIGSVATTQPSLMLNLLGPEKADEAVYQDLVETALITANAHVHDYGKKDLRPFRKLGHITFTGERDKLLEQYAALTKI
jgi:5-(carboxyamino)imidazole ribonucleotide synthase